MADKQLNSSLPFFYTDEWAEELSERQLHIIRMFMLTDMYSCCAHTHLKTRICTFTWIHTAFAIRYSTYMDSGELAHTPRS